jgi:hypothetical protein
MRLAADEITLRVEDRILYLRPSLRAAARLERGYGFPALYTGVAEGNLTVITDLIRAGAGDPSFELFVRGRSLAAILTSVTVPLFEFVMMMNGLDEDQEPEADPSAARVTFAELYEDLFAKATGALGWPPEVALDASPAEIRAAYKGRIAFVNELLGAVFPAAPKPDPIAALPVDTKIKLAMARFGARAN